MSDAHSRQPTPSPAGHAAWAELPRQLWRFLALAVRKGQADKLPEKAAALAFTTIVALIPLLAAFSFLGARWFNEQQAWLVEVLGRILPYSEAVIVERLGGFLEQAETIRGLGFIVFVVTALAVFSTIEKIVNQIWNVPRQRPFRSRLLSFTLLLFWGPLVIGATYFALYQLRQYPAFERGLFALPAEVVPFAMTLLGLTMLYWLVPYTTVDFRSALVGGFIAAFLLEAVRQGFGLYVELADNVSLIYGGFGFALLFMISIQLTWWIVLWGAEAAYCIQNFEYMSRHRRDAVSDEGSWIALAALAFIAHRFAESEPITPHEMLAEGLQIEGSELQRALAPLVEHGLLREVGGDAEGYLLAGDPHELPVVRVFALYEDLRRELLAPLPDRPAAGLEALRARVARSRDEQVAALTLADLVAAPAGKRRAKKSA